MALHFTDLNLFKALVTSTGTYTEGSIHKCAPKPTVLTTGGNLIATLSATPGTSIEVIPKNGDALHRMEISTPYIPAPQPTRKELCDPTATQPCFLTMKLNGNTVYGWIDDITAKISKGNQYSYVIDWHVDWWLTAGNLASYGSGRLLRGPDTYARPSPSSPRKWVYDSKISMNVESDAGFTNDPWFIIVHTKTVNGKTFILSKFWQPGKTVGASEWPTLTWSDIYEGYLEERLEIDPTAIIGAYMSPVRPYDNITGHQINGYGYYETTDYLAEHTIVSLNDTVSTTDTVKYIVTDAYGTTVGTLPWMVEWKLVKCGLDIGTAGVSLIVKFLKDASDTSIGEDRVMSIPLHSIPVTDNSWSSYNYSGEREYDKTLKKIQQDQNAVNGIAGIGTGLIGGAIAGSMVAPGAGTIAGAIGGAITSGIGTAVGYQTTGMLDRKTQSAVDQLKSNQTSNLVISAGGMAWLAFSDLLPGTYDIVKLVRDPISKAELESEQSEIGYVTDTILASASTLIASKGPLQIQDLQVSGLNPEGNRYISAMFARGVHLD